jgi:hypothetical protein
MAGVGGGNSSLSRQGSPSLLATRRTVLSAMASNKEEVMEWYSQKTEVAGIQIPNWGIVLGAVIVVLLGYSLMH